jgi:Rps23 Pro-64 3,4-dihydroxylase Tpa1-like proline 4-hydroxylase
MSQIFIVDDFLSIDFINETKKELLNIPEDWWYISLNPTDERYEKENFRNFEGILNNPDFVIKNLFNLEHYNKGNFAYRFKRNLDNHYENCYCVQCNIKKYFDTNEIKDKLSNIVGCNKIKFEETFCSRYDNGDYLSIHHDKGNGDYAFVFQLTENWNPTFGGLLHFYDSEKKEIYKTINPKFNSLTIFKIKNVPITDHFVSTNTSSSSRYAYTGWFSIVDE